MTAPSERVKKSGDTPGWLHGNNRLERLTGVSPGSFLHVLTERKHFIDTIKLIAYRAETSMASLLRDKLSRADDARALLRQIYDTEVDLIPDLDNQTLTVRLHHLTQAAHDEAVRYLCDQLNATATIFPGTELRLVYQLGASQIP